jgi:hypothetical protein
VWPALELPLTAAWTTIVDGKLLASPRDRPTASLKSWHPDTPHRPRPQQPQAQLRKAKTGNLAPPVMAHNLKVVCKTDSAKHPRPRVRTRRTTTKEVGRRPRQQPSASQPSTSQLKRQARKARVPPELAPSDIVSFATCCRQPYLRTPQRSSWWQPVRCTTKVGARVSILPGFMLCTLRHPFLMGCALHAAHLDLPWQHPDPVDASHSTALDAPR